MGCGCFRAAEVMGFEFCFLSPKRQNFTQQDYSLNSCQIWINLLSGHAPSRKLFGPVLQLVLTCRLVSTKMREECVFKVIDLSSLEIV